MTFNKSDPIGFLSLSLFAILMLAMCVSTIDINTTSLFIVSALMFITCLLSALHLMGRRPTLTFASMAVTVGFFAEYLGTNYGWVFGEYKFTDALQPQIFGVPIVIPMMWFVLTYIAYVVSNILLERRPVSQLNDLGSILMSSVLGAMIVTAYDLAADPYMVFVVKAWIMKKADGWWFGETLHGFVGWFAISFFVSALFRLLTRKKLTSPRPGFQKKHALIPVLILTAMMGFQTLYSLPVETRTVAFFALGIPLMIALFTFRQWRWNEIK